MENDNVSLALQQSTLIAKMIFLEFSKNDDSDTIVNKEAIIVYQNPENDSWSLLRSDMIAGMPEQFFLKDGKVLNLNEQQLELTKEYIDSFEENTTTQSTQMLRLTGYSESPIQKSQGNQDN